MELISSLFAPLLLQNSLRIYLESHELDTFSRLALTLDSLHFAEPAPFSTSTSLSYRISPIHRSPRPVR